MTQLVGGPHDGLEVEFHPGALYLDIPEAEGVALVAFSRYDRLGGFVGTRPALGCWCEDECHCGEFWTNDKENP